MNWQEVCEHPDLKKGSSWSDIVVRIRPNYLKSSLLPVELTLIEKWESHENQPGNLTRVVGHATLS
jgi:hypothetical protein